MLKNSSLVAFVGVSDLERAQDFYGNVLGLEIVATDDFAIQARVSGTTLRITKAPKVVPAAYTVLGFAVAGIEDRVDALVAKGVSFERYPFLGESQSSKGIWNSPSGTRVAWFKDPDGNVLSLSEA